MVVGRTRQAISTPWSSRSRCKTCLFRSHASSDHQLDVHRLALVSASCLHSEASRTIATLGNTR